MSKSSVSALIIAKNEELMIENCINSLKWCDEIIVIDDGSLDKTREIAETYGAKVISFKHDSFSRLREEALKRASSDWVIYIDSDERVTPVLAKEIKVTIETTQANVLRLTRKNIHFGKTFKYGGWQNDRVERVFKKDSLSGWTGDVHESPIYKGELIDLKTELIHYTHRDVISGLLKTVSWTPVEAKELFEADLSKVTFLTILRKGGMEFLRRAVINKGYKDGMAGMVESIIQAINKIIIYIQVWEMQQSPPISELYSKSEQEIINLWNKEK